MNPTAEGQLITGPTEVRMSDRGAPPRPGQQLLFSTDDGRVEELDRRPSAFGAVKYTYRYEVDTTDHLVQWTETLGSGTAGFSFHVALEARWRVDNAVEVVKRNIRSISDGETSVRLGMRDLLWPHACRYPIERGGDLQEFLRTSVSPGSHSLAVGITVVELTARVYLEEHAANHLRALKQAEYDVQLVKAGHLTTLTEQTLQEERQRELEKAMLAAAKGEGGLLIRLLAQEPGKLHEILLQMVSRQDMMISQKERMLKELIDADMVQPAEAQAMWQQLFPSSSGFGMGSVTDTGGLLAAPPQPGPGRVIEGALASGAADGVPKPRYRGAESSSDRSDGWGSGSQSGPDAPADGQGEGARSGSAPSRPQSQASANVVGSVPLAKRRRPPQTGGQ